MSKGQKRKKKPQDGGDSDGHSDDDNIQCVKVVSEETPTAPVCSCPKDVMRCIGILPSLPIVRYYDSDDSESSSNEDLGHTVLPITRPTNTTCEN